MEFGKKELHTDLDTKKLQRLYSPEHPYAWHNAWSDVRKILEDRGFEHTQYSVYCSSQDMDYQEAYLGIDELCSKLPWFQECVKKATITEIGQEHNIIPYLKDNSLLIPEGALGTNKELHFDFDDNLLKQEFSSHSWRSAWEKLGNHLKSNGFIHTQHSGYETRQSLSMETALSVLREFQIQHPWFASSLKAATLTEIGRRHDALSYIKNRETIKNPDLIAREELHKEVGIEALAARTRSLSQALNQKKDSTLQVYDLYGRLGKSKFQDLCKNCLLEK